MYIYTVYHNFRKLQLAENMNHACESMKFKSHATFS